jgi:sulfate transporter 4
MQPNKDQDTATDRNNGDEGGGGVGVPPSSTEDSLSPRFAGSIVDDPMNLNMGTTADTPNHQMEEAIRRRTPFVSRHRKALNHIDSDSRLARRHPVPSSRPTASGGGGSGGTNDPTESIQNLLGKWTASCRDMYAEKSADDWMGTFLPMYSWLKGYPWRTAAVQDLVAGLTVGVMIVPQSMSYAKLAGLPVEYGLYSSFIPVFTYSLFGSSRQLAVGPVAIISLLLSTGITQVLQAENIDVEDPLYDTRYMQLAVQISFLVGVTNILMGLMRLGFVTNFLSHAVISGFTSGASVIIGMSQLKYIFGYEVKRSDRFHEVLQNIFENISEFNWKTFVMGTVSIAILMLMKHVGKTVPKLKKIRALGPLSVTVLGIILSVALDFGGGSAIPLVGDIPKGLPSFTAGEWLPLESMDKLILITISIAIVGFMESIAIAKTLASKHKYEIDSSMELIGLGMVSPPSRIFFWLELVFGHKSLLHFSYDKIF